MEEAFKDAWFDIDRTGRGSINVQDLWMYMKKQNQDDILVNKWMRLFDKDGTGIIHLEKFCDVLGLDYKQTLSEVRIRASGGSVASLPAGVEHISGDMNISWQIKMAQLCLEGLRSSAATKDVPKWIKTQADRQFSQLWHVVMVNGQFWCYYGHEPGHSFVFRYEKNIFIVWKTPSV